MLHPIAAAPSVSRDSGAWHAALLATGRRYLDELAPLLAAAEAAAPAAQRVMPSSRMLCAALGLLGQVCYEALGGRDADRHAEVGRVAAMLSLLTKIDDQVIDGAAFHGGRGAPGRDHAALRARVVEYLAPTLRSIETARPCSDEPRCQLAAQLGESLRALTGEPERLARLLAVIASGWEVQAEAVTTLSSHPSEVRTAQIADITRRISGAWLLMIAMCGSLPRDAARSLSADEEAAFYEWGGWIQRADALADLDKDLHDGMGTSVPGRLLYERAPHAYLDACARDDIAAVYELCVAHGVDLGCLPPPAARPRLLRALPGEMAALLGWIQHFLLWRYLAHPLCRRAPLGTPFAAYLASPLSAPPAAVDLAALPRISLTQTGAPSCLGR